MNQSVHQLVQLILQGLTWVLRTIETLWDRIGALLDDFTPNECASYFRHDGYPAI